MLKIILGNNSAADFWFQ